MEKIHNVVEKIAEKVEAGLEFLTGRQDLPEESKPQAQQLPEQECRQDKQEEEGEGEGELQEDPNREELQSQVPHFQQINVPEDYQPTVEAADSVTESRICFLLR